MSDLDRTQLNQRAVSDPRASAWVVANAGSGKTHVLTQRVIRLLLAGADPASVLCLTFTKVAAAEMAGRVFGTLAAWATLPDERLRGEVEALGGAPPSGAEVRAARRLFARALETPGGLKIQTIHAFCERLLHQFPFEANVPGQFAILDDNAARSLLAEARGAVMNRAAAEPRTRLGRAMRTLAETAADPPIGEALDALISARGALRRWMDRAAVHGLDSDVDNALADLGDQLGLRPGETEEAICHEICAAAEWACGHCGTLAELFAATENRTDEAARAALQAIHAAGKPGAEADRRLAFFLTDGNQKVRSPTHRFSRMARDSRPRLTEDFAAEAERLVALAGRLALARAHSATEALLVVGDAILQSYGAAKRRAGMLDFADLIAKTRNLLSRSDAAQWVLFKLDRRIDHILVDEAQDTSPDQWAVVQALAEDFFSGAGARGVERTIFAVGDDKQSIFGFQGAAPHMLAEMRRSFGKRVAAAEARFVERPLFLSFRSTHEVLAAVDIVFDAKRSELISASGYNAHASHRPGDPGHVVVMPRIVRPKVEDPEDWATPFDAPSAAETQLAQAIAEEIGQLVGSRLPSGKRVEAGEILVLVRRRDAFAAAMNRALRARRIPTAGADRIPVATHIAVLDLLALADATLLPEDDLQLAACLKSPLVGLGEEALMQLAVGRERASLWTTLQAATDAPARRAAETLRRWRAMADQVTPFRFFATILGPEGGRRAFRARLGGEADDVLDTLLSQALAYEALEPPSLQGFVRFVRANESDIKREAEEGASGVRVMTVHGAKGLEADVVFLVDTGGLIVVAGQRDRLVPVGPRDDPAFFWRRAALEAPPQQRDADAVADEETKREYLRLLYVAMTRARDVLYVAGIKGPTTDQGDPRWHKLVERALVPGDAPRDPETGELAAPYLWPQPLRPPKEAGAQAALAELAATEAPDWLSRPSPTPVPAPRPLRPSRALAEPDPRPLPDVVEARLAAASDAALKRGLALHGLLQALPDLPPAERRARGERFLARNFAGDAADAASILAEAEAVLADPALAELYGPASRAEAAIVGRVATDAGDYAVSGRIDRLARTAGGWRLLDFKTDRRVPASAAAVAPAYVLQIALYRRLLTQMQPGAEVAATLVYTAGPKIVPIPAAAMEEALAKLGIGATALA